MLEVGMSEEQEPSYHEVRTKEIEWQSRVLGRALFKYGYLTPPAKKAIKMFRSAGIAPKKRLKKV